MTRPDLLDDLADAQLPDDTLQALAALLDSMPAPTIRPDHQTMVLASVTAMLPQHHASHMSDRSWHPWHILISQATIVRQAIWLASALVLVLGLVITLLTPTTSVLLFTTLAPMVAAAGVAALYSEETEAMLEVEAATAVSGLTLLLARLVLVFGYNLCLGLLGSLLLALTKSTLLMPLIMSWLAPMTLLCGLAFFLSVLTAEPFLAGSWSLLLWLVFLLATHVPASGELPLLGMIMIAIRTLPAFLLLMLGVGLVASTGLLFQMRSWQRRSLW